MGNTNEKRMDGVSLQTRYDVAAHRLATAVVVWLEVVGRVDPERAKPLVEAYQAAEEAYFGPVAESLSTEMVRRAKRRAATVGTGGGQ